MRISTTTRRILSIAASAAISAAALTAHAQYKVNTGNALDANNRLGSGGTNGAGQNRGPYSGYTAQDIINGTVTGGLAFRGFVPYRSTNYFSGPSAGVGTDRFVRDSSSSGYYGYGGYQSNALNARQYYSGARLVDAPAGFVPQGTTGSYVPNPNPSVRLGSDLRLGDPMDTQMVAGARPGQLLLPGPVDSSTGDTMITASPLYGVRGWRANNALDQQFLRQYTDLYSYNTLGRAVVDDQRMRQYRDELLNPTTQPSSLGASGLQQGVPNPNLAGANAGSFASSVNLAQPLASNQPPSGSPLPNTPDAGLQGTGGAGALGTNQAFTQRVIPPAQQSTQYAALQDRLKRYYADKQLTDADRARIYNAQRKQIDDEKKAAELATAQKIPPTVQGAGDAGAGGAAPAAGATGTALTPPDPNTPAIPKPIPGPTALTADGRPKPPQIRSMESLITPKAKGVGEILKQAENLMRQGKYIDALDQYDTAEQIGAKYAAVQLGRANAELGASYYTRADVDIRQAFTQDPSLLEGQYDLGAMIGDDRLQFLVKDLKEIANKEKTLARPVFLLAYIAYNTGNERMAAGYLDLAEKRAGGADPFYKQVRDHWVLPQDSKPQSNDTAVVPTTQPELNK